MTTKRINAKITQDGKLIKSYARVHSVLRYLSTVDDLTRYQVRYFDEEPVNLRGDEFVKRYVLLLATIMPLAEWGALIKLQDLIQSAYRHGFRAGKKLAER